MLVYEERATQERRLRDTYQATILHDIAKGLFGGDAYTRPEYSDLLSELIGQGQPQDERSAEQIIQDLYNRL